MVVDVEYVQRTTFVPSPLEFALPLVFSGILTASRPIQTRLDGGRRRV
jgi:hypothetical protein